MAKRRMISQTLVYDEEFNSLSIEAQTLFFRMLCVADDCGVVPAGTYALSVLINPPARIKKNLDKHLGEIVAAKIGSVISYEGKPYFLFKQESYRQHQSYVINKRVKSEYLKMSAEVFDSYDFTASDSQLTVICSSNDIESNKQKVESRKQRVESNGKPSSIEDIITFCKELKIPQADAEYLWHKWEGNGWTNGGKAIKDWRATVRSWQKAGYLPSQKNNTQRRGPPPADASAPIRSGWWTCPDCKERMLESYQITHKCHE